VRSGDTLWDISRYYRVSMAALCQANGLAAKARIRPGQSLVIPAQAAAPRTVAKGPQRVHHRIRPGDSLSRIARRYRVSVNQLRRWNRPAVYRLLKPGTVLVVYPKPHAI
jgi:membrane-bound lytic murein transglycosylase D